MPKAVCTLADDDGSEVCAFFSWPIEDCDESIISGLVGHGNPSKYNSDNFFMCPRFPSTIMPA